MEMEAQALPEAHPPLFVRTLHRRGEDTLVAEVREPGTVRVLRVSPPGYDDEGRLELPTERLVATLEWDGLSLSPLDPRANIERLPEPQAWQALEDLEEKARSGRGDEQLHPMHKRELEDELRRARDSGRNVYQESLRTVVKGLSDLVHQHLQAQLDFDGLHLETLHAFHRNLRVDARGCLLRPETPQPGARDVPALLDQGGLWIAPGSARARLVLTSSVLSALSYRQLRPNDDVSFLVIGPERPAPGSHAHLREQQAVRAVLAAAPGTDTVVLAFDADERGAALVREVQALAPDTWFTRALPERGRSWNQALRHHQERERDLATLTSNWRDLQVTALAQDAQQRPEALIDVGFKLQGQSWRLRMEQPGLVEMRGPFEGVARLRWDGTFLTPGDPLAAQHVPADMQRAMGQVLSSSMQWGRMVAGPEQLRGLAQAMHTYGPQGIRPETLDLPRFSHSFDVNERGQLRTPVFDKAGRQATDGVWCSAAKPSDKRLVFTASASEALAYHQAYPTENTRYVAIGPVARDGVMTQAQREAVKLAIASMPYGASIVAALGQERRAAHLAAELQALAPEVNLHRHLPPMGMGSTFGELAVRLNQDWVQAQHALRPPERAAPHRSPGLER